MFVCCEWCMLSGWCLCDELITRPEESYRLWRVVVCDLETWWMRSPWPIGGCRAKNEQTCHMKCVTQDKHYHSWQLNKIPVQTRNVFCSALHVQATRFWPRAQQKYVVSMPRQRLDENLSSWFSNCNMVHAASNWWLAMNCRTRKEEVVTYLWYYSGTWLVRVRNATKTPGQGNGSADEDSNGARPEEVSEPLPLEPLHSNRMMTQCTSLPPI
jgi:hypothetical protein